MIEKKICRVLFLKYDLKTFTSNQNEYNTIEYNIQFKIFIIFIFQIVIFQNNGDFSILKD